MNGKLFNSLRAILFAGLTGGALLAAAPVYAQTTRPARKAFTWVPPSSGVPSNLSSATARGEKDPTLATLVLAPIASVGTTTQASPTLFWYTTKPTMLKTRITIIRESDLDHPEPVLKMVVKDPLAAGIQCLDMSRPLPVLDEDDHETKDASGNVVTQVVKLEPGVKYRWSVHLLSTDNEHADDVASEAIIQRIEPSSELTGELGSASDDLAKAAAYAHANVWYDMFASLSRWIDQNPGDATARTQRADVMRSLLSTETFQKDLPDSIKSWAVTP